MALFFISGKSYELIHENRAGWNPEAFRNRYSDVLERYDYVIGDWGYNQLRLKGFFRDGHQKAPKESVFSSISDYINEYCNFGCAYFILEKKQTGRKEFVEGDIDLDDLPVTVVDDDPAEESELAVSAALETDLADDDFDSDKITPPVRERRKNYNHQRSNSSKRNQQNDARKSDSTTNRKPNRNTDHRNKKPVRLVPNEAAATSDISRQSKKDAGRS